MEEAEADGRGFQTRSPQVFPSHLIASVVTAALSGCGGNLTFSLHLCLTGGDTEEGGKLWQDDSDQRSRSMQLLSLLSLFYRC